VDQEARTAPAFTIAGMAGLEETFVPQDPMFIPSGDGWTLLPHVTPLDFIILLHPVAIYSMPCATARQEKHAISPGWWFSWNPNPPKEPGPGEYPVNRDLKAPTFLCFSFPNFQRPHLSTGLTGVPLASPMAMGMVSPKPSRNVFIPGAAAGKTIRWFPIGDVGGRCFAVLSKTAFAVHLLTVCIL